jgi:hypothetical protein
MRDILLYGLSATHARPHRCLEDIDEAEAGRSRSTTAAATSG